MNQPPKNPAGIVGHLSKVAAGLLLILSLPAALWAQAGFTLEPPRPTWLDNAGNPLSGGSVTAYQCGTTTPLNIYSDATLLTPLPNPVTLNSAGRAQTGGSVESAVYLSQNCYKFIVKDSGGAAIYTQDSVYPGVPMPTSGTPSAATFLKGNYTWGQIENVVTATNTGTQNDFAPGLVSGLINIVHCNNASDLTLTGLSASGMADGTIVIFDSIHATGNVYFKHQNAGSAAANRFTNLVTSGDTPIARGAAVYLLDANRATWRLIQHDQGQWITPTFAAGNYTASSAGSWTVGAGDVTTAAFFVKDRTISVLFDLLTTTVAQSGGQPTQLNILNSAYGSFLATNGFVSVIMFNDNATGNTVGFAQVAAGGNAIGISKLASTQWANSTDQTNVYVVVTFQVS